MIGNNSCGIHSVMAGRTEDNVESLDVLTYDGLRLKLGPTSQNELEEIIVSRGCRSEIYAGLERIRDRYADLIRRRFPDIPRRVSGFGLDQLLPEKGFHVARALQPDTWAGWEDSAVPPERLGGYLRDLRTLLN